MRPPPRFILIATLLLCAIALGAWIPQAPPPGGPKNMADGAQLTSLYLPLIYGPMPPQWLGPDGGMIAAVAASPQDSGRVYAGSWGG